MSREELGMGEDFRKIEIREIRKGEFKRLLFNNHYMKYLPQINHIFLGGYIGDELVGGLSLGWGVRPKHTIKKLFPSLGVDDYKNLGRLCLKEKMPRNSESHFISKSLDYIKKNYKDLKVLFSWSDGILGKPGYVYQASNFHYGGYIWTDMYLTEEGERVHPRQTNRIGGRPSYEELKELGWKHYRGKQLRYVYFLCNKGEEKRLKRESDIEWVKEDYPKEDDLEWKVRTDEGWVFTERPDFDPESLNFNKKKKEQLKWFKEHKPLEEYS